MKTLPQLLARIWGQGRAAAVAAQYRSACEGRPMFVRDLAMFCNAAAPLAGDCEFDRGVEEGKRRVWLHIARLAALAPDDFVSLSDGDHTND